MRLGVLDVGSNTVHLLVVDAHRGAEPTPQHSDKSELRLAEHIDKHGNLNSKGEAALVRSVADARKQATALKCDDILAFATSAVRDANNSDKVLRRVARETGVDLQVLSGEDEARLTFLAVRRWLGWSAGTLISLDIGGGSLELAAGGDEDPEVALSLPLGAARLTREHFHDDPPGKDEVAALRAYIDDQLAAPARKLLAVGTPDRVVATSKTFRTLARLSGAAPSSAGPRVRATAEPQRARPDHGVHLAHGIVRPRRAGRRERRARPSDIGRRGRGGSRDGRARRGRARAVSVGAARRCDPASTRLAVTSVTCPLWKDCSVRRSSRPRAASGYEKLVTNAPVSRDVVRRYVGGATTDAAVEATGALVKDGLTVTLDHLGEDTTDRAQADGVVAAYRELLAALQKDGLSERLAPLTARAEVSVKLSAVGQALGADGEKIALDHAREICAAADAIGATVTLDAEDHTTTDSTLGILGDVRADFPATGAVVQAYLKRTEGDCRDLATSGSRVRLCKGAYKEPASVAFQKPLDVDLSYVRCANILMAGDGYPMLATHDPRLIEIGIERAAFHGKQAGKDFELQMLYGIRPNEQRRLAEAGHTVRIYLPYGAEWYGYLMRRLAERPANMVFFARSLVSKG